MARRLRIEYAGALYHVINRGNYRRDVFESVGAAEAFLTALFEAAERFGWEVHGYVLMRNHYHLAIGTPEPTLVAGMHWLQSTLATRFNRFRREQGHLFQGRYKSLLIEEAGALGRVVDYIHLNPVRAKVVPPAMVAGYRWSSLGRFVRGPLPARLRAEPWLSATGRGEWADDAMGWKAYVAHLTELAHREDLGASVGLAGLSRGWAIGTNAWRKTIAKEHAHLALHPGLAKEEVRELRTAKWELSVESALAEMGRSESELESQPRKQPWKIDLAARILTGSVAPIPWLAERLKLGKPATLRSYLYRARRAKRPQTTA